MDKIIESIFDAKVIFSGLIGALVGSLTTIIVFWYTRHISTKRALADRLEFLRHDVYWKKNTASDAWDVTLLEIWQLYNAFYEFALPWRRCRIKKAWEQYKGIKKEAEKKVEAQGGTFISKTPPDDTDDLFHRIKSFLKAL